MNSIDRSVLDEDNRPNTVVDHQYIDIVGEWSSMAPLPVARGDAAMTTIPSQFGDRLLVLGGESEVQLVYRSLKFCLNIVPTLLSDCSLLSDSSTWTRGKAVMLAFQFRQFSHSSAWIRLAYYCQNLKIWRELMQIWSLKDSRCLDIG